MAYTQKTGEQYARIANRAQGEAYGRPGAITKLAISSVDANSTLVAGQLYYVFSDVDCWINVDATATSSKMPLAAKVPLFIRFAATSQSAPAVHAITASGVTGNIYFVEMSEADNL